MKPKERFLGLDGLRGVAALSVAQLHLHHLLFANAFLPHADLAVDFFFVLSGFVIAHAYDVRIAQGLTCAKFIKIRLVRLYPMIAAGLCLGLVDFVARHHPKAESAHLVSSTLSALFFGSLLLPVIPNGGYRLNPPSWSLLYELITNFIYALLGRRLTGIVLGLIVLAGAIGLIASSVWSLRINVLLDDFGWLRWGREWPIDLSRSFYSFFAGVALFRLRNFRLFAWLTPLSISGASLMLVAIFAAPPSWQINYQLPVVLVLFPLITLANSRSVVSGWDGKISSFLGRLSYPLYAVHFPVALLSLGAIKGLHLYDRLPRSLVEIVVCLTALTAAYLLERFYDRPTRMWLANRLLR